MEPNLLQALKSTLPSSQGGPVPGPPLPPQQVTPAAEAVLAEGPKNRTVFADVFDELGMINPALASEANSDDMPSDATTEVPQTKGAPREERQTAATASKDETVSETGTPAKTPDRMDQPARTTVAEGAPLAQVPLSPSAQLASASSESASNRKLADIPAHLPAQHQITEDLDIRRVPTRLQMTEASLSPISKTAYPVFPQQGARTDPTDPIRSLAPQIETPEIRLETPAQNPVLRSALPDQPPPIVPGNRQETPPLRVTDTVRLTQLSPVTSETVLSQSQTPRTLENAVAVPVGTASRPALPEAPRNPMPVLVQTPEGRQPGAEEPPRAAVPLPTAQTSGEGAQGAASRLPLEPLLARQSQPVIVSPKQETPQPSSPPKPAMEVPSNSRQTTPISAPLKSQLETPQPQSHHVTPKLAQASVSDPQAAASMRPAPGVAVSPLTIKAAVDPLQNKTLLDVAAGRAIAEPEAEAVIQQIIRLKGSGPIPPASAPILEGPSLSKIRDPLPASYTPAFTPAQTRVAVTLPLADVKLDTDGIPRPSRSATSSFATAQPMQATAPIAVSQTAETAENGAAPAPSTVVRKQLPDKGPPLEFGRQTLTPSGQTAKNDGDGKAAQPVQAAGTPATPMGLFAEADGRQSKSVNASPQSDWTRPAPSPTQGLPAPTLQVSHPVQPTIQSRVAQSTQDKPLASSAEPDTIPLHRFESVAPASTPIQAAATRMDLPTHVARQIMEIAQNLPGRPVEIALSPEELGRVRLAVSTQEAGLVVHIAAERPETLDLLRRNVSLLGDDFQALGYDDVAFSFGPQTGSDQSDAPQSQDASIFAELSESSPPIPPPPTPLAKNRSTAQGGLDVRL